MTNNILQMNQKVQEASAWLPLLRMEMSHVIVGQKALLDRLIIGLLANGHVLLEGVPGLAKTLSIRTLAAAMRARFSRLQFTPDLLPADIIGTLIYNMREGNFQTKKGPIFANIILADEINRAPAKVQSALLEAMQERQVTLGEETFSLPSPFFVLATENPIDQEGTYPLPEAQVDRFLLKVKIDYPSREEERHILDTRAFTDPEGKVSAVIEPEQILTSQKVVDQIYVDEKIKEYILNIVSATRKPSLFKIEMDPFIQFGASPRAAIGLLLAAKAWAFMQSRGYVTPQDVKSVALDVLCHRIIVSYEAEAEEVSSEQIVQKILDTVPVP